MANGTIAVAGTIGIFQSCEKAFPCSSSRCLAVRSIPNKGLVHQLPILAFDKFPYVLLEWATLLPPAVAFLWSSRTGAVHSDDRCHACPQRLTSAWSDRDKPNMDGRDSAANSGFTMSKSGTLTQRATCTDLQRQADVRAVRDWTCAPIASNWDDTDRRIT